MGMMSDMFRLSSGAVGPGVAVGAYAVGALGVGAATLSMDRDTGPYMGLAAGSMLGITGSTALMAGSAVSPAKLWYLVDGSESIHQVARPYMLARGAMRAGGVGAMLGMGALGGFVGGIAVHTVADTFGGN
jgi:hypothetical protein